MRFCSRIKFFMIIFDEFVLACKKIFIISFNDRMFDGKEFFRQPSYILRCLSINYLIYSQIDNQFYSEGVFLLQDNW